MPYVIQFKNSALKVLYKLPKERAHPIAYAIDALLSFKKKTPWRVSGILVQRFLRGRAGRKAAESSGPANRSAVYGGRARRR